MLRIIFPEFLRNKRLRNHTVTAAELPIDIRNRWWRSPLEGRSLRYAYPVGSDRTHACKQGHVTNLPYCTRSYIL